MHNIYDCIESFSSLLDNNDTIFKYNRRLNTYSMIQADYLMKNRTTDKNVFIFLSRKKEDKYFCRSFFPEAKRDYAKNQASWTLLYKEKERISTGESVVLYNRLKKNEGIKGEKNANYL